MGTPVFQKGSPPTGFYAAHADVSSSADKILLILLFASPGAVVFLYFAYFVSRLFLRVLRRYRAKASIDAISPTEFKSSDGVFLDGASGVDCVVCLSEIRDGELVRVLPKCRHVFHVPCIDPWLKCHPNCPVCRANIAGDVINIDVDLERGAPAVSPAPAGAGVSISTVPVHIVQPFEEEQRRVGLMENGV